MTSIDWLVLGLYLAVVLAIGVWAGRRREQPEGFFLAGRSMPLLAVAISVFATATSAATFIGGPEQAYKNNLTYLSASIGAVLAAVLAAVFFLPAFYRRGITTVYELLQERFGPTSRRAASATFMIGRVMASGARLYMVAIPFGLVVFGSTAPWVLVVSILSMAAVATIYTSIGGIRAVIWTDVLQAILVVGSVVVALAVLTSRLPLSLGEVQSLVADATVEGGSKLQVLDLRTDPGVWYTLWTALVGWMLFNLAALTVDQDLAQRTLTCRSARSAGWSVVISALIGVPVTALFLTVGLLLFIYYRHSGLLGDAAPAYAVDDSRKVFLTFILNELGPGLRGLIMAGLFAAAMSSLDSALNALASTTVLDFHRPFATRHGAPIDPRRERRVSRLAVVVWAIVLSGFACGSIWWQQASGRSLIDFALGVMVFAYGGLLAVFIACMLSIRGGAVSTIAALVAGGVVAALLARHDVAMPWQMTASTGIAFIVCVVGGALTPRRSPC